MAKAVWTTDIIKQGIDKFFDQHGNFPTAWDFDKTPYLPSARQVQRAFGGLEALRISLGYSETNYTKGQLRRQRSIDGNTNGLAAEDRLEILLINRFGEPFVHTQKRYYKKLKNRYDFFIYAYDMHFGIDVFTTQRREYIGPNIRHKLLKYKDIPPDVPVYFIVASETLTPEDVEKGTQSALGLKLLPNISVMHIDDFIKLIDSIEPLAIPLGYKSVLNHIEQK